MLEIKGTLFKIGAVTADGDLVIRLKDVAKPPKIGDIKSLKGKTVTLTIK